MVPVWYSLVPFSCGPYSSLAGADLRCCRLTEMMRLDRVVATNCQRCCDRICWESGAAKGSGSAICAASGGLCRWRKRLDFHGEGSRLDFLGMRTGLEHAKAGEAWGGGSGAIATRRRSKPRGRAGKSGRVGKAASRIRKDAFPIPLSELRGGEGWSSEHRIPTRRSFANGIGIECGGFE
jgi:hypothetical protein